MTAAPLDVKQWVNGEASDIFLSLQLQLENAQCTIVVK